MIVTAEVGSRQLADLIKQVQAGDEVLLTQGDKPVAKIVTASEKEIASGTALEVRSIKGHRVLTPIIAQGDVAEEMSGERPPVHHMVNRSGKFTAHVTRHGTRMPKCPALSTSLKSRTDTCTPSLEVAGNFREWDLIIAACVG
jgi:prevent-host-death family protein